MNKKFIAKIAIFVLFFFVGGLIFISSSSAQTCPVNTVAEEKQATLVGETTDDGGDPNLTVWFQYGKTSAYGLETSKQSQYGISRFCATVYNLDPCTTYHFRAVSQNSGGTSYGENRIFTTICSTTTVDIKANNSDGPITIDYNTSATLKWTSANVDSCYASNGWSGSKSISGSESTGNLTSSKTYTLTCTGPGGSASDSVTVNVSAQIVTDGEFSIKKTVRNLSKGTVFSDSIYADPADVLIFGIVVKAGSDSVYNIVVKDVLPAGIIYRGDLRIDNILTTGDVFTGLNIGNLAAGQKKTITFRGDVAGADSFSFGQTELTNSALVSAGTISHSDTAKIIVTRTAVAGAATEVPTGLTNNPFFDSFLLPVVISLLIVLFFKSHIIQFEEWLDSRKKKYQEYRSKKLLQLKIARIRTRELLQRKIF